MVGCSLRAILSIPFILPPALGYAMSSVYYISCYGYKTWTCNIICYDIIPILPYTLFFVLTWKRLKNSSKSYKSFCIAVVGGPKEIAKEIGSQMCLFFRMVLLHSHKKFFWHKTSIKWVQKVYFCLQREEGWSKKLRIMSK